MTGYGQTPTPPEPWDGVVSIEVWSFDDRIIHRDQSAEERLLREAQYVLSGMIYGWEFVYTPADPNRNVQRYFELTPLGTIPWGDPRLTVRSVHDEYSRLYGLIDYRPSQIDRRRRGAWSGSDVDTAAGVGTAPLQDGFLGKQEAIHGAIRNAVREYLRRRRLNRPREAIGSLILQEAPRIRTVDGMYEARVSVFLRIERVRDYVTF